MNDINITTANHNIKNMDQQTPTTKNIKKHNQNLITLELKKLIFEIKTKSQSNQISNKFSNVDEFLASLKR